MWNLYKVLDEARNEFYVVASGTEQATDKYNAHVITLSGTMHGDGRTVLTVNCIAADEAADSPWATFIP